MKQYRQLLQTILTEGELKCDRTGVGVRSTFGLRAEFDLQAGFPIVTGKYVPYGLIVSELLWFIHGHEGIAFLHQHNNHIWDEWVRPDGTFGPIYGVQWRSWQAPGGRSIDQLAEVIQTLQNNPDDRRMIVSAWNVAQLDDMALPPCHCFFQFYVRNGFLDCQMYQRSCDMFLGVPLNIASYATLIHIIARCTDLQPGRLIWVGGRLSHLQQPRGPGRQIPRVSCIRATPATITQPRDNTYRRVPASSV